MFVVIPFWMKDGNHIGMEKINLEFLLAIFKLMSISMEIRKFVRLIPI